MTSLYSWPRHSEIYTLALTRVLKVVPGGQKQPQKQVCQGYKEQHFKLEQVAPEVDGQVIVLLGLQGFKLGVERLVLGITQCGVSATHH